MNNKFDQLQKIIIKLMRKFKVPGLAISILQDNKTVYEKGNEDDWEYLADNELRFAPDDPGTYEGGNFLGQIF